MGPTSVLASLTLVLLSDVLAVTAALGSADIRYWVAGGWGVDALVGRQTRSHRDLDVAVGADQLAEAVALVSPLGYQPETDWLPVRLELAAPGERWVDLHPVVFDAQGNGQQEGLHGTSFAYPAADLTVGWIDGYRLPCLSVDLQRAFHSGYAPRPVDLCDLALLTELAAAGRGGHHTGTRRRAG